MPRQPFSTIPEGHLPAVVLVAPGPVLLEACRVALRLVTIASVEVTDVAEAATCVAKERPFAIVIEEDVLAFDPKEFQALAKDVGGEIVAVPSGGTEEDLVTQLLPALKIAFKRWDERQELSWG